MCNYIICDSLQQKVPYVGIHLLPNHKHFIFTHQIMIIIRMVCIKLLESDYPLLHYPTRNFTMVDNTIIRYLYHCIGSIIISKFRYINLSSFQFSRKRFSVKVKLKEIPKKKLLHRDYPMTIYHCI